MPTIALVDDDRNILTSVSIALEAEGYRIMTYTDGASALDGFKSSPPDLAILDIKMPRMDGMETLRRLRQKSDMPVIFLTSKDEEIDELFGLKMGADDFIRKPFSQRLLVERVKAVLRRSGGKDGVVPKEIDAAKVLERGQLRMDPERPDGCRLRRPSLRRRPHHRQPHQAPAEEIQADRRLLRRVGDPLRGRLPIQGIAAPQNQAKAVLTANSAEFSRTHKPVATLPTRGVSAWPSA